MEQTELIHQAAGLISKAATANANGLSDNANAKLAELLDLLQNWLIDHPPEEPEKPEAASAE